MTHIAHPDEYFRMQISESGTALLDAVDRHTVADSHVVATITLTEDDLIEARLPLARTIAEQLAEVDVLTLDMIDTSKPRSQSYAMRCRRVTGSFGEYGTALLSVDWPLSMVTGQRVELIALRTEGETRRIAAYFTS